VIPTIPSISDRNLREAQVQLSDAYLRPGRVDGGDGSAVSLDVVVELAPRNRPRLGERSVALEVAGSLARVRLALGELRLGLIERRLKGARVDLEENVVLADEGTFAEVLPQQISGHLRLDLRVDVAVEGGDPLAIDRHVLLPDRRDFHSRGRRGGRGLRLPAASNEQHDHEGSTTRERRAESHVIVAATSTAPMTAPARASRNRERSVHHHGIAPSFLSAVRSPRRPSARSSPAISTSGIVLTEPIFCNSE